MSVQMFGSILVSKHNHLSDVFPFQNKPNLDKQQIRLRDNTQRGDKKYFPSITCNMRNVYSYNNRPLTTPIRENVYLSSLKPTVKLRCHTETKTEMENKCFSSPQTEDKTIKTLPRSRFGYKRYERSGIRRIEWLAKNESNYSLPTTVREDCTSALSDCAIKNSFKSYAKIRRSNSLRESGTFDYDKKKNYRYALGEVSKRLSDFEFADDFELPPQSSADHWMGNGYNTGKVNLSADKGYLLWTNPKGTLEVTFTYKDSSQEFRCYIQPQLGDGVRIYEVKGRNDNKELILNSCKPPPSLETPFFCMTNPFRADEYSMEFHSNSGKIELLLEAVRRYKSISNNRKSAVFKINYTLSL